MRRVAMHRRRSLAVACAVFLSASAVIVALPGGPAGAAPSPDGGVAAYVLPVTVTSDGWITYQDTLAPSLGLVKATTVVVSGKATPQGCSFSASGQVAAGAAASYQEEVAYNPATCQMKVVTGGLTAAALAKLSAARPAGAAGASATADRSASSAGLVAPDAYTSSQAYQKSAWIDPIDITITSFADDLTWTHNGTFWGSANASDHPYEFAYDGWSNSGTPPIHWTPDTASQIGLSEHEEFVNTDFEEYVIAILGLAGLAACGFTTAPAVFDLTDSLTGLASGGYNWSYNDNKSGGCSNLVHHNNWNGFGYLT